MDVGNAASLACLQKSATAFGRGTERIGVVHPKMRSVPPKTNKLIMRKNCTTNLGDCVEYVFAKDVAKFWDDAKACGAWDGSDGAEAGTSGGTKKRGRPSKEAKLTGGARKQYKTAKNVGATGKGAGKKKAKK